MVGRLVFVAILFKFSTSQFMTVTFFVWSQIQSAWTKDQFLQQYGESLLLALVDLISDFKFTGTGGQIPIRVCDFSTIA